MIDPPTIDDSPSQKPLVSQLLIALLTLDKRGVVAEMPLESEHSVGIHMIIIEDFSSIDSVINYTY